ncbi:MAG: hypothetical protein AOA66_0454 [Candidatus Bathyarchaeota archaeon BA2]|nr:MAG: hypothetical protein AOA66_0454 [Candidatus Bathyarchaeota archaeon BA2]
MVKRMRRFDLNSARTYVGSNVNLHLKDGSVIINVLVTKAVQRKSRHGGAILHCVLPTRKKTVKVSLGEIEWAERLGPHPLLWH